METDGVYPPGPLAELLGRAAFAFAEVQPYLPMYMHLILSALFPIFTGAHSSLSRPSSAAKPKKSPKKGRVETEDDDDEDDEEEEDSIMQKMEGLSPSDAIIFPVLAGSTLAGLYFLIKWMGPDILNKILNYYFSSMAIFSVGKLVNDGIAVAETFCWPTYYVDEGVLWHVKSSETTVVEVDESGSSVRCTRSSPLPGVLGRLVLPSRVSSLLWSVRGLPKLRLRIRFHLKSVTSFNARLTARTIFSAFVGLGVVMVANFVSRAWWLTNLQGFAFSYSALQLMSPTTFSTGTLILVALFFYDIYFVFFTPMMVAVATKLDVPIKLVFPRPRQEGQITRSLAMLGLGDVVLPGIMIGLALRFDLYMHYLKKQTSQQADSASSEETSKTTAGTQMKKQPYRTVTGQWGNRFWTTSWTGRSFIPVVPPSMAKPPPPSATASLPSTFPKPYFHASIIGYVVGMCVTLGVMQVFQHAQPALLYLVPGVLSSLWLTAVARGELKQMWEFSEASDEDPGAGKDAAVSTADVEKKKRKEEEGDAGVTAKTQPNSSWWSNSFFSSAKSERNAKILEERLARNVMTDDEDDATAESKSPVPAPETGDGKKAAEKSVGKAKRTGFFSLSVTLDVPRRQKRSSAQPKTDKIEDVKQQQDTASGSDENDAVLITDAEVKEAVSEGPVWRGAKKVGGTTRGERAEKRLRTS